MLQSISPTHDTHHLRQRQNSIASLTASLDDGKTHLLLAASGSVATIKLPLIIQALTSRHPPDTLSIRVLLTPCATRFLAGQSDEQPTVSALPALPGVDGVYGDADEWREPWRRGDGVLHIELRRWAHALVIAPLSANTLAKIAGGFADGLLTSVVRAWDAWGELDGDADGNVPKRKKRILVAPAMNTAMWRHPVTAKHLRVLEQEWGVNSSSFASSGRGTHDEPAGEAADSGERNRDGWFEVLQPQQKTLVCGDVGDGAMMEWSAIVPIIEDRLGLVAAGEQEEGS
ncbi:flavoprotein [Biscogniauxia mediterranea]|nr:flavoprotein [Biscogniauxia mediterranea]